MANRYWVGGNANWDATAGTKWALTSGGAGGQAVPTAADDVFLDNGTGTGNVTIPSATTVNCRSLDCTGYVGTLTFAATSSTINIGTSTVIAANIALKFVAGMTLTLTGIGTINFVSTSTTQVTVASGGKTMPNMTFNGAAGTWKLSDAHTLGTTTTFSVTQGTVDLNGQTLSCGLLSITGASTRTFTDATGATGTINVTGNNATVFTASNSTNLTITTLPTINFTYSGGTGTRTITGGSTAETEAKSVNIAITAGTDIVAPSNSFGSLNLTGFAGTFSNNTRKLYGSFTAPGSITYSGGSNATTFAATSGTKTLTTNAAGTLDFPITINGAGGTFQLADNLTLGTTRTFTFTAGTFDMNGKTFSVGIFSATGSGTRTFTYAAGTWNITGNATTVLTISGTNITWTTRPAVNLTYSGSTGTRTIHCNENPATVDCNVTAGSDIITSGSGLPSMDFTGFTGSWSMSSTVFLYGGLKLVAGMTWTHTSIVQVAAASGTWNITLAGKTLSTLNQSNAVFFGNQSATSSTATWVLQDTFRAQGVQVNFGTLDGNDQTLNIGAFAFTGTNTRAADFTNCTLNIGMGNQQVFWSATGSGGTLTMTGSTINLDNTLTSSVGISFTSSHSGITYNTINVVSLKGSSFTTRAFTGPFTVGTFNITAGTDYQSQLFFTGNVTVSTAFTAAGNSQAKRMTFFSDGVSQGQLILNGTVSATDIIFQGMTASGSTAFTGTRLGDAGGNSGITFTPAANRYWVGNGGSWGDTAHWSTSSGGATGASVPLPQDTAYFDANSFSSASQVVDCNVVWYGSMIWTGVTNNPALNIDDLVNTRGYAAFCGTTYTMSPNMTMTGNGNVILTFETGTYFGRTAITQTITSNGFLWNGTAYTALSEFGSGLLRWFGGTEHDYIGNLTFADSFDIADGVAGTDLYILGSSTSVFNIPAGVTVRSWGLSFDALSELRINGTYYTWATDSYPFDFDWGVARTVTGTGTIYCNVQADVGPHRWSISASGFSPALTVEPTIYCAGTATPTWLLNLATSATLTRLEKHPDQTHHLKLDDAVAGNRITTLVWDGKRGTLCDIICETNGVPAPLAINQTQKISFCRLQDVAVTGALTVQNGTNTSGNSGITFETFNARASGN